MAFDRCAIKDYLLAFLNVGSICKYLAAGSFRQNFSAHVLIAASSAGSQNKK